MQFYTCREGLLQSCSCWPEQDIEKQKFKRLTFAPELISRFIHEGLTTISDEKLSCTQTVAILQNCPSSVLADFHQRAF